MYKLCRSSSVDFKRVRLSNLINSTPLHKSISLIFIKLQRKGNRDNSYNVNGQAIIVSSSLLSEEPGKTILTLNKLNNNLKPILI